MTHEIKFELACRCGWTMSAGSTADAAALARSHQRHAARGEPEREPEPSGAVHAPTMPTWRCRTCAADIEAVVLAFGVVCYWCVCTCTHLHAKINDAQLVDVHEPTRCSRSAHVDGSLKQLA